MRLDKLNDIPFAWYWEGRPLRGNQIRPVYTGTHSSSPYHCVCPVPGSPSHSRRSSRKTKESPCPEPDCCSGARHKIEPCDCSSCNDANHTDAQYPPAPEYVAKAAAATAAASSASCSSTASDIHYHSHSYFCCPDAYDYGYEHDYDCDCDYDYDYPLNTTQSSSSSSCSCCSSTTSHSYYHPPPASPPDRCPCGTCSSPSSSSSQTRPQMHYKAPMTDTHHGHPRHRRRPRSKTRRSRGRPSEDDSVTMSGYTDSSMYSDCSRDSDVELESCECCAPAYRGKKY